MMNIFGIHIGRATDAPEEDMPLVQTLDAQGRPITQAQLFSVQYARGTARKTLADIAKNAANAATVTKLVMLITMPHQIGYLLSLAPFKWVGFGAIAESITFLMMALLGPLAVDYLTLICIRIVASKSMMTSSKAWTCVAMILPVGFSGWVNFIAPGPSVYKIMAAFLVSLIPVTQIVQALGNRPDFRRVDQAEREVTKFANEAPAAPSRTLTEEEKAQRRATREANRLEREAKREANRLRGLRAAASRKANEAAVKETAQAAKPVRKRAAAKTPVQEIEELTRAGNIAPVSAAPVTK